MGGDLIRESRKRAGLTQAALAERLGTTQSVIARWESGRVEPKFETVRTVLRAAGFSLLVALDPYDDADMAQAKRLLRLSPAERIDEVERTAAFVEELRTARRVASA